MMKDVDNLVDLNEIIQAFDLTNDYLRFFLNTRTGQIVNLIDGDDFSDFDDEDIDAIEEGCIPEDCVALPNHWDLNKYEIIEDFCSSVENEEIQDNLFHAIRGKGAFGRFYTALHCYKIEKDWYEFQHLRLKEIAINFCNEHKISYQYSQ